MLYISAREAGLPSSLITLSCLERRDQRPCREERRERGASREEGRGERGRAEERVLEAHKEERERGWN